MTCNGTVQNGVVILENGARLPNGTRVSVHPLDATEVQHQGIEDDSDVPTLYEQLEPLIGTVGNLPSDMAANHDHYLHGHPKR